MRRCLYNATSKWDLKRINEYEIITAEQLFAPTASTQCATELFRSASRVAGDGLDVVCVTLCTEDQIFELQNV